MSNIISLYLSSFTANTLGIANGINNADSTPVSPNSSITIDVNQGDTIQWLLSSQSDPNNTFSIDQYNALPSIFSTYPTPLTNGWEAVFNDSCPTGVYRVQINWSTTSGDITQSSWASIYFNVVSALLPQPVALANTIQFFLSFGKKKADAKIANGINGTLGSFPLLNLSITQNDTVEFLLSDNTSQKVSIVFDPNLSAINGWSYPVVNGITTLDVRLVEYTPPPRPEIPGSTGFATIRINAS